MVEIHLLYVSSLSNSLVLCVFSSFIRPITYAKARREHAFDASGSSKPEPQQRRQWEGANIRQMNPSPQTLRSPKTREHRSWAWLRHAKLRNLVEVWALTASARRQIGTGLFFHWNLCRFRSKFAWALPLSLSLPWTMNFFLRNDKYGQEMKISSKCPTSAIASLHVKYVKGC